MARERKKKPRPQAVTAGLLLGTLAFLAAAISAQTIRAQSTNVAATPPMGWNSWNKFGCNVSDNLIREMAPWSAPA